MNLQEVRDQLAQLDPNNRDNLVAIAQLKAQEIELEKEAAAQARIETQIEKVESITLPFNFDEVFDDPSANEMIIELIKDLQLQAYADHNAEIATLTSDHEAELQAVNDSLSQLKTQYDVVSAQLSQTQNDLAQTRFERDDALAKRDAAVRHAEGLETLVAEKQAHIDKLRDEIAIGAKAAVNVTNISPSDKLAQLIQERKNAKVKSALDIALENSAPFRGKVIKDGELVAPLNAPQAAVFPYIDSSSDTTYPVVTGPIETVPTPDQVDAFRGEEAVQSGETVDLGNAVEVREGVKTVEERLSALELHVFGKVTGETA